MIIIKNHKSIMLKFSFPNLIPNHKALTSKTVWRKIEKWFLRNEPRRDKGGNEICFMISKPPGVLSPPAIKNCQCRVFSVSFNTPQ